MVGLNFPGVARAVSWPAITVVLQGCLPVWSLVWPLSRLSWPLLTSFLFPSSLLSPNHGSHGKTSKSYHCIHTLWGSCLEFHWWWKLMMCYIWYNWWLKFDFSRKVYGVRYDNSSNCVYVRDRPFKDDLFKDVTTLEALMLKCCARYTDKQAFGTREILEELVDCSSGKPFKKVCVLCLRGRCLYCVWWDLFPQLRLGNYKWMTFGEFEKQCSHVASALAGTLKLKSQELVIILSDTRVEWLMTAHACFKNSMIVVTLYATLSDDSIIYCELRFRLFRVSEHLQFCELSFFCSLQRMRWSHHLRQLWTDETIRHFRFPADCDQEHRLLPCAVA